MQAVTKIDLLATSKSIINVKNREKTTDIRHKLKAIIAYDYEYQLNQHPLNR